MKNILRFCLVASVVLAFSLQPSALVHAQSYYTNSVTASGAYLPNASVVPATQPGQTLAAQYAHGINTGVSITYTSSGLATNTFATNYVYSAPPVVMMELAGSVPAATNAYVTTVTTTYFIYSGGAQYVTNTYIAIGH